MAAKRTNGREAVGNKIGTAKKVTKKPAAKKVTKKPAAKKATKKPAAKKATAKKAAKKKVVKKKQAPVKPAAPKKTPAKRKEAAPDQKPWEVDPMGPFRKTFGDGKQYKAFDEKDRARLQKTIPNWLLDHWEHDGWAVYGKDLLWMVDPSEYQSLVDLWKPPEGKAYPVFRTAFGVLFLLQPFTEKRPGGLKVSGISVAEVNPHTGEFSIPGGSASLFFFRSVPKPEYQKVFWDDWTKDAMKKLGPLEPDEMYTFDPPLLKRRPGTMPEFKKVKLFDEHRRLKKLVKKLNFVRY